MLKVLFATSEAHPLIKTGGLADVSGALPIALNDLKCDIRIILPAFPQVLNNLGKTKTISRIYIPGIVGNINLLEGKLPKTNIKVLAIDYSAAFDREGGPYLDSEGKPWQDNAERFALFSKAVCKVALNQANIKWQPEIVHCNDWQTGLIPAILRLSQPAQILGPYIPSIFTIHNLAYQGLFPRETFVALGLPTELWGYSALEFHNQMSLIKGGLVFADRITTVSPKYALEIQDKEMGYGLEGLLRHRRTQLLGILNGIDDRVWNPATDPLIEANYDHRDTRNKLLNKHHLQNYYGLAQSNNLLLGFIGRLVEQKGIDLIIELIPKLKQLSAQLVILGSGENTFETQLKTLENKYPDVFKVKIGYDETLAHKIEAGIDAFLMPSKFEPCGLNQMYSLRYGSIPIVTNVGGLSDSVVNVTENTLKSNTATGFVFDKPDADELLKTVHRAVNLYKKPEQWASVVKTGMNKHFDWQASAQQYLKLYHSALNKPSTY